ncbi:hypothetical protein BCY84_21455 [Trypanosoma cruzi cruzi]|nr:hypothetical protein BCY84_21455 [Trypanosoma cruzi cruzi]
MNISQRVAFNRLSPGGMTLKAGGTHAGRRRRCRWSNFDVISTNNRVALTMERHEGDRRRGRGRRTLVFSRATFVLLTLLCLGVAILGNVAEAALVFVPTNVLELSLYQTAQLRFSSNIFVGDPPIRTGDTFYFVEKNNNNDPACNPAGSGNPENKFTVTASNGMGILGFSTIVVKSSVFTVGSSYLICYITQGKAYLTWLSRGDQTSPVMVWSSVYNHYNMQPPFAFGGLELVDLTVIEQAQAGRPINQGLGGANTIFLIPCRGTGANCGGTDHLPELCASQPPDSILLSNLRGVTTMSVTGSFTVPYVPSPNGYAICVPYCYDASLGCGTSVEMSYTVVTDDKSTPVINFGEANPSSYSVTPAAPQALELSYMLLTGRDLTDRDVVRVIRSGSTCGSPAAPLLTNLRLIRLVAVSETLVNVTFIAPELITQQMRGIVCYRHAGSLLWSSVRKNPASPMDDFVIDILQPTGFTMVPETPSTGETITLFFLGTGLDASTDEVFLTTSPYCNDLLPEIPKFPCKLSGGNQPQCVAIIDPPLNQGLTLHICYRKGGQASYARINGTVVTQSRNPIYTIRPYPLYAGQKGTLTFHGRGLSLRDSVNFLVSGSTCGEGSAVNTFFIANGVELEAGKTYQYDVVGSGKQCLQICYRIADSTMWSIARPRTMIPVVPTCEAKNLYVSTFNLRYTSTTTPITAKETVTLTFLPPPPLHSAVKLVRMDDKCVVSFCKIGGVTTTACEIEQNADDFTSDLTDNKVNMMAGAATTSYILCTSSYEENYIPVLPSGQGEISFAFAFETAAANPTLQSHTPQQWRVALASLQTKFGGHDLNSTTDSVLAVLGDALLSTTPRVCPPATAVPSTALLSTLIPDPSTTTTTAAYSGSHRRYTGDVVYFCYLWSSGNRITYTGSLTFAARLPSEMTATTPLSDGFRAGVPITLNFTSNTSALQPEHDELFFYRFKSSFASGSNCYCGAECPAGALVSYPTVPLTPGASPTEVLWKNPQGLDNYNYDAIYVVCYNAYGAGSPSYMGRLTVGMAQPTFYTATSADVFIRVGSPITVTAIQRCTGAGCRQLSTDNDMRLIPVEKQCFQVDKSTVFAEVEFIGKATSDGTNYAQRLVFNQNGEYRVCYRLEGFYQELTPSVAASPKPLAVGVADPVSFTTIPASPSAGQFTSVQLSCSHSLCTVCTTVRLVPGNMASCWVNVDGNFSSDTCRTVTLVEFWNQYLPQGTFTVCYGASMESSRRVPGILLVAAANPSTFTASHTNIFVNQVSEVTLTLVGTGLTTNDQIFLLTTIGYSCHDLTTGELQSNGTLSQWFAPSINPNPLIINALGTTAEWNASDREHRFGAGLLSDPFFCDHPGQYCTLQLCYMRSGTTWAPVPIENQPPLRLLPSNPTSAFFDKYPLAVGMYSAVTVVGNGLAAANVVTVRKNTCGGEAVTVPVGTATVTADGKQWLGVVRFTGDGATNYAVCYTCGTATTEIDDAHAGPRGVILVLSELYYLYDPANFTENHVLAMYEELMVGGTFAREPVNDLSSAELISAETECNYMPYYIETGKSPEFSVLLKLQRLSQNYFGARFTVEAGTYALCLQVNLGLFRVVRNPDGALLTTTSANPPEYTSQPDLPFPEQPFTLTFPLLNGDVGENDSIHLIEGTFYDCGFHNTSSVAEFPVVADPSATIPTGIVSAISLPARLVGVFLTVCYRRTGGTFATVPRDGQIDHNLHLVEQIPSVWTTVPVQPQVSRTLQITFIGDKRFPDFLQTTDRAALVLVTGGSDPTCSDAPAFKSGDLVKVGENTMWVISADQPKEGKYIVCYTSTRNGAPVRVMTPPYLTIYPTQSPLGIFKNDGGPVDVYSGERFYLMFDTKVPLDPVLSSDPAASQKDAVLFSTKMDCSSPLPSSEVASIPASFHYKPVKVKNPSGIIAPYLHIVMVTTAKSLFVCMRRVGRTKGEAFYKFEMIGDIKDPAMVHVSESPIERYVTQPLLPRAWVPSIGVKTTYSTGYYREKMYQLFFTKSAATVDIVDNCYRPTAEEAAEAQGVILLDTTLQVILETGRTLLPFPQAGRFQLCLQLKGNSQNAASVHATPLTVLNPSPIMYIVPEIIAVGATFQMAFLALDNIFASSVISGNIAQVFVTTSNVARGKTVPDCANGVSPPSGGRTKFADFTPTNDTYATVRPLILEKGYFYVCFLVYDQLSFFPVPNSEGGFLFSVGLTGAQSYVVVPSPAYMGDKVNITIRGNALSNKDHVKIVDITGDKEGTNHSARCTAEAEDADAEERNGARGSVVDALSPTLAEYKPRVNKTGLFILCYQSAPLQNRWMWVSDWNDFTVCPPHPDAYAVQPVPFYVREVGLLRIQDSPTTGLLGANDEIKLVKRGSGVAGFDCSADAEGSPDIGRLARIAAGSSRTTAKYELCALATTRVTVCYLLEHGAWAEVPLRVPPPSYLFEPVVFFASPFEGPTATPSAPRPYEPFEMSFTSKEEKVTVNYVGFAPAPQPTCAPNPPYITPVYYVKNAATANSFMVALPKSGAYQLYLGPYAAEGDPRIEHEQIFTVASCDPCSFTPSYSFISNNVSLTFPSSSGGSLSLADTVRLVPVSQGAMGNPCAAPTGAFASVTLEANTTVSTVAATVFDLFTGSTEASLGDYYVCYRKGRGNSNYAIVTNSNGELLTFSIYPALPTETSVCQARPFFLETVTFNFSFASSAYPKLAFSDMDEFLLLPTDVVCGAAGSATAKGVIRPVLLSLVARDLAMWLALLPNGHTTTNYQICFRLAADAVARVVPPSMITVAPQDPVRVVTVPWQIKPDTENFQMLIYGMQLSANDDVYVVDASQRCDERCGEKLNPTPLASAVYTKTFVNNTLVELEFTQALKENVAMAVCYRRVNQLLVRLALFYVGRTNPEKYSTNFVPRVGTRPVLTFVGTDLTALDRVFILPEGINCDESYAVAVGTLVDATSGGTSRFYMPLVGDVVVGIGEYGVCYFVHGSAGYALMSEPFQVQAGGPSRFITSNTPMRARAMEVTFDYTSYTSQVGDMAMVACAGCSCWSGNAAVLPYGNPQGTVEAKGEQIKLRVGITSADSYAVCYRVFDSGYAQVGLQPIRVIDNSPAAFSIWPIPTFQGQRLIVTVMDFVGNFLSMMEETNDTEGINLPQQAPNPQDAAMIVEASRLCWDTVALNPNGILAGPSEVSRTTPTESLWRGHVPSLGPGALPLSSFPMLFMLCYREHGQEEFVVVPFPPEPNTMLPANPSSFVTVPPDVFSGMIHIRMTFPDAAENDTAFVVEYPGDTLQTNHACDDTKSKIIAAEGPAFPSYIFSLPPQLTAKSAVVCYVRADATVAEVPQLLILTTPNPADYLIEPPAGTERQRQYLVFEFTGTDLNPTTDAVVFTEFPCANSPTWPPVSASSVRRASFLAATPSTQEGTSLTMVAQFVQSAQKMIFVCYRRGTIWSEVDGPLSLDSPLPISLTLVPPVGRARVGQHVQIQLQGTEGKKLVRAAVISAHDSSPESWCQNFTAARVQEPLLTIVSDAQLSVPIWQTAGPARVCVRYEGMAWSDVALTATGPVTDVVVEGPNPSSMRTFPNPPRVGQQVTLTFQLSEPPSADDRVRIATPERDVACEDTHTVPGFSENMPVSPNVEAMTSSITPIDSTDPLAYRSFNHTGQFRVCYYSAAARVWSIAGGSVEASIINVLPMAPETWKTSSGMDPVFAEPFELVFEDSLGSLDASGDSAWSAPPQQSCGVDPVDCPGCIIFELDKEKSTAKRVVTKPAASLVVGNVNLCYRLRDATAALIPPPLIIQEGEIRCVQEKAVRVGQQQNITFEKKPGVDVTGDSWRVSFFGTTATSCSSGYVPDFVAGRAHIISFNSATVTYTLEWPVSMVSARYLICYTHNGVARTVCTCEQIQSKTGECYLSTLQASPLWFVPNPDPTYVGQTIQLQFTLDTSMINYPVTRVKLVPYVNLLTVCTDQEAFPTGGNVRTVTPTLYVFQFKYSYNQRPGKFIVCALSPQLSEFYARVGTVNPATSSNQLWVRPYMELTTFPSSANLIRAMQTIRLTFTHISSDPGDVVGAGDRITFVPLPENCVESFIDTTPAADVMALFMVDDTSFSTVPAPVLDPSNVTRSSHVFVTFDPTNGLGNHFVCYKLTYGTWAPVTNSIDVLPSAVTKCDLPPSTSRPDPGMGPSWRAMQYVRAIIVGTKETSALRTDVDAVRVVPQASPCISDASVVFQSGVSIEGKENAAVIAFSPRTGIFKICYRIGGPNSMIANWSPVCTELTFTQPSPTGTFTGCLRLGQSLIVTASQQDGFQFTLMDTFRFVNGADQCLYADGSQTVSGTITVGDAAQVIGGTPVTTAGATFVLPPALLGTGTVSFRLCFKDSANNQFAVPIDATDLTVSEFDVAPHLIASVLLQHSIAAGQRVFITFAANPQVGVLTPYAAFPPVPFSPGPVYDGNFDAATAIRFSSPFAYREGRCFVANPTLNGVYGNSTQTLGSFDPTMGGSYVACYRSVGCSVEDVGLPFLVSGYNPASFTIAPPQPRRGQILDVTFFRNTRDRDALPLTPGGDRAVAQVNLFSCWNLPVNAGEVVGGTAEITNIWVFFAAQNPASRGASQVRVCYRLEDGSWSEVPGNVFLLQPANPFSFTVLNGPARVQQLNQILFRGNSLGAMDRVKIITKSDLCTDASVPPSEVVSRALGTGDAIPGTANGWTVTNATSTATMFNMSSTIRGEFIFCYKLAADTVWTRVYGELVIGSRDPAEVVQTPGNAVEGELFTLNFTASEDSPSLSEGDRVAFYTGDLSCLVPGHDADVIITSPSRTDLLPRNLLFQLAAGTSGNHTLCYWKSNGNVIVWGFETVVIGRNPWNYTTHPAATFLRANQLVSAIFWGFGLIADPIAEKSDQVKFIPTRNPQTDAACQTIAQETSVVNYPLTANGTLSVQVVRFTPPAVGFYWVCYKLNGGQFNVMGGDALVVGAANPCGAIPAKNVKTLWDGEMNIWTIDARTAPVEGGLVFYSVHQCNNFPYYVTPEPSITQFPHGVAVVRNGVALLRTGSPTGDGVIVSLCYYAEGVITMLSESVMQVVEGVPPVLKEPVPAMALQLFRFALAVVPTPLDYVVLVANSDDCVGLTAPASSSDIFISFVSEGDQIVVTTAVELEGTFYICYSHRVGPCGENSTEECARIVGTVVASAPNPSDWFMTPNTVYTSEEAEIHLVRRLGTVAGAMEELWLTPINITQYTTMKEVALACIATMTGGDRIVLQPQVNQSSVWKTRLNVVASYALCYLSEVAALPTIFPPLSRAGPVVQLTNVASVVFPVAPVVGTTAAVILQGRGLSQDDQLVAVGVPATGSIPADICTNSTYTPRVTAEASKSGYGLRDMVYHLVFESPGSYVLCFQAVASTGPMVLITPNSFEVDLTVLSFTVVSVALTDTPIELEFRGSGLRASDEAALVFLHPDTVAESDICAHGKYTAVSSASPDGTTSLYVTVVTSPGTYAVCYTKPGFTPILLPNYLSVSVRTATGARFTVRPSCSALSACSPQPVVALINASGDPTSDPGATVVMHLKLENGTAADELLSGGAVYTQDEFSIFYFFEITISTVGTYVMEAEFNLRGGVRLVASLPNLVVTKDGEKEVMAVVTCVPVGIIERSLLSSGQSNPNVNITCVIETKSPLAPKAYTVQLNAGKSTDLVLDGDSTAGLPRYNFTVNPPYDQPLIQFVSIVTEAAPPFQSWPVMNSPVIVRIGSIPEENSTLFCASNSMGLPSKTMVRLNGNLTCQAQGKRMINGVEVNIVALPKYMRIFSEYDDDVRTDKAINIGAYPENLDGNYIFYVNVNEVSSNVSIIGNVPMSQTSIVYVPMKGSPSRFTVIGEPQSGESRISCVSESSGSMLWFTPVERFQCTLSLRAGGMPINGVSQDFLITMPEGGSTEPMPVHAWGPTLFIQGATPPIINNVSAPRTSNQLFSVLVTFTPLSRSIASTSGTLVYADIVELKKESGGEVSLTLMGSGLSPSNKYGVRSTPECAEGVDSEARVTSSKVSTTELQLSVKVAEGPFYLCFAPSDQPERWQSLSSEALDYKSSGDLDKWKTLLIVGVILLLLLLILLVVVVWRVCMFKRREESQYVQKAVYMPPRANYRFLRRDRTETQTTENLPPSAPTTTSQPSAERKEMVPSPMRRSNHKVRINIHDHDAYSDVEVERDGETKLRPVAPGGLKKRESNGEMKKDSHKFVELDSSEDEPSRFIPSVPPPKPPRDDDVIPLIGAVEQATEARLVAGEETSRSGPYQHLHRQPQERPPMEAQFSPSSNAVAAATSTTTTTAMGEDAERNQQWVGPFLVRGHTSRPMVNQNSPSNGTVRNGDRQNGN